MSAQDGAVSVTDKHGRPIAFRCVCRGGRNHCYCHIAGTTPDCEHCATAYWRADYVPLKEEN